MAKELEHLKTVKRREISAALEHARLLGDLRENAEYSAAKEAVAFNEKRIRELEYKLTRSEILDDVDMDKDKALIGAKLKLVDVATDFEIEYTLVAEEESNPSAGFISVTCPVGKALLGHKKGDIVDVKVKDKIFKYKIVDISR